MRDGGEDDGKRVFSDAKCVWSLGKREMSSSMRDGISICVVLVVVLMVVVGMDGGVDGSRGSSGGGNSEENIVYRSGRVCGVFLG